MYTYLKIIWIGFRLVIPVFLPGILNIQMTGELLQSMQVVTNNALQKNHFLARFLEILHLVCYLHTGIIHHLEEIKKIN